MRLLFVDDEEPFREAQTELFGRWGYSVYPCASEEQAAEYLRTSGDEIDLAVVDMRMEDFESGLRLVQILGDRFPRVPAVVLTGFADVANAAKCMEAGAFSYVPKEHAAELLRLTLQRASQRRRLLLRAEASSFRQLAELRLCAWWVEEATKALRSINVTPPQYQALTEFLVQLHFDQLDRGSLLPVPDEEAPRVKFCDLLQNSSADLKGAPIPANDRQREVQTYLECFPELTGISRFLQDQGFPDRLLVECHATHTIMILEFRARGFALPAKQVSRLNELFAGSAPKTECEVLVIGFVLKLTGLAAKASATVEGKDTVIRVDVPLA